MASAIADTMNGPLAVEARKQGGSRRCSASAPADHTAPGLTDLQPADLEPPGTGAHPIHVQVREPSAHQASQKVGVEAIREQRRLGVSVRALGQKLKRLPASLSARARSDRWG